MNRTWGNDEDAEIDDDIAPDIEFLIPSRQRNQGDIGTRDYYDRLDRMAREISDGPR
ncbi:MAG TPA: hypothetical protein VN361_11830 [Oxalicibacterium sp.]|nr:hypothetical protein [Oxalicibacterium sp.]